MSTDFPKRNSVNQDSRRGAAVLVDGTTANPAVKGKHSAAPVKGQADVARPERRNIPAQKGAEQTQQARLERRGAIPAQRSQRPAEPTPTERNAAAMKKKAVANVKKERDRSSKVGKYLALFICGAVLFAAGFALRGFDPDRKSVV